MNNDYETLRWPTNLDRAGIEKRLVEVREVARRAGLEKLAKLFDDLDKLTAAQLGAHVVGGLTEIQTEIQGKPEHSAIATQLEMVAMNLKNLKK